MAESLDDKKDNRESNEDAEIEQHRSAQGPTLAAHQIVRS
jgi:hypothetical protein